MYMTERVSLDLLEKRISILKEELEHKLDNNIRKLSSPEILTINNKIDELMVTYINLTLKK